MNVWPEEVLGERDGPEKMKQTKPGRFRMATFSLSIQDGLSQVEGWRERHEGEEAVMKLTWQEQRAQGNQRDSLNSFRKPLSTRWELGL